MKRLLKFLLHFDHWTVLILTILFMGILWLVMVASHVKNPFAKSYSNTTFTDVYYHFANKDTTVKDAGIVIVDIGQESRRNIIAQIISTIDSLHPLAIGVDVFFVQKGNDSIGNKLLEETLTAVGPRLVLGEFKQNNLKSYFADSLRLQSGDVGLNTSNYKVSTFNVLSSGDTSFVAKLNRIWGDDRALEEATIAIDYHYNFMVVSPSELEQNAHLIKNSIVLVGDMSSSSDMYSTPLGKTISGVEIHAYCLQTLHDMEHYPRQVPLLVNLLLAVLISYLLELALSATEFWLSRKKTTWSVFLLNSFITKLVLWPLVFIISIWMMDTSLNGWHYNMTLLFTTIALTILSRNIYKSFIRAFRLKHDWEFLNQSLIS